MTATKNAALKSPTTKATNANPSANVPGQFYGYSIQNTRVVVLRA